MSFIEVLDGPLDNLRSMRPQKDTFEQSNYYSDTSSSKYCYPGSHATFSSNIFLSIYDEEELFEQPNDDYSAADPATPSGISTDIPRSSTRPTIYYLLRLFDSLRGFHKGYLDLSGRHPERYYQLQSQWNRFLCNFLSLGTEIRADEAEDTHGEVTRYCVVFNSERWQRFQMKWRLPESTDYSQLLRCTQLLLRDLKQNPIPRFQNIRLPQLPAEVLDNIFGVASVTQAKMLASTCHTLNDIGQRHLFQTWHMKLHVPFHITPFNVEYSSIDLSTVAYYSRLDLQKNVQFLLSKPHIVNRIQRLVLTDEWWVSRRAFPHEDHPFILGIDFYKSVTQIFSSPLTIASRLTTLVLCNLEMNLELTRRISEVHTLHTLELHLCHIPHVVQKKLGFPLTDSFPLVPSTSSSTTVDFVCAPQIANLQIYMDSSFQETHSQWHSLLLCPHVRTLSVVQSGLCAFPTPDPIFWSKCCLDNLERLSLDNIDSADLAEVVNYFATKKPVAAMHMTHFKLHMDWGLPDLDVVDLLLALQYAPMEVLVLEGLADADPELFDHISTLFPNLLALTLVRRHNRNQHQNKLAVWPKASWEYAEHMNNFRCLRHFCWNFMTEYWDATPVALLSFETEFRANHHSSGSRSQSPESSCPTLSSSSSSSSLLSLVSSSSHTSSHYDLDIAVVADEVPYFLDSHWMALPFVAHCPTLVSFSLMDRTIDMVCRIVRHPNTGTRKLIPKYYPTHSPCFSWGDQTTLHPGSSKNMYGSGSTGGAIHTNTTGSHWPSLMPFRRE